MGEPSSMEPQNDVEKNAQHETGDRPSVSSGSVESLNKTKVDESTVDVETASSKTSAISRFLLKVRARDDIPITPPPDGGFQAWLTATLVHFVSFNTWGLMNSFGIFQTYYVDEAKIGTNSQIAWIGSTTIFFLFFMAVFSGRLLDAGYYRITFVFGNLLSVFGLCMLSLCKTYWQVFLAQAVCVGIGFGCAFVPSLGLTATYFLKNRPYALALAAAGTATGGIVFPIIAEQMIPKVGFPWTIRTMALVQLILGIVCSIFLKPRLPPRKSGPLIEWSAFTELPYLFYVTSSFFAFWSIFTGFFFIASFSIAVIGTSQSTSLKLLMILNGIGLIGRILPAYFATRWGAVNTMVPIVAGTCLIGFCWLAVKDTAGLWAFTICYGIFAAGIQSLFATALTSLTDDPKKMGARTGMGFAVCAFSGLTGPPIAGVLIAADHGGYTGLQLYAGVCMLIATVLIVASRWAKAGWTSKRI